jgi:hypothetical protein
MRGHGNNKEKSESEAGEARQNRPQEPGTPQGDP